MDKKRNWMPSSSSSSSYLNFEVPKNDHMNPDEFFNQQKEIDKLLSNGFDDITDIKHFTNYDDLETFLNENDNHDANQRHSTKFSSDIYSSKQSTSTPLLQRNNQPNLNELLNYNRRKNERIIEEPEDPCNTIEDVDSLTTNDNDDNLSLSTNNNNNHNDDDVDYIIRESPKLNLNHDDDYLSDTNKDDNDVHIKDLYILKQEFSQINTNYQLLRQKFQKLYQQNQENRQLIEQKCQRIAKLESQTYNRQDEHKLASLYESKINSLERQLAELQQSKRPFDKDNQTFGEEQMKWFETIKLKHQKELNTFKIEYESKIDKLTKLLERKDDEMIANCNILLKYKKEMNYYKEKVKNYEANFDVKLKQEIDHIKETMMKSFDESMKKLKNEWENKLNEDINKIIDHIENNSNDPIDHHNFIDDLRFEKLIKLYHSLKLFQTNHEQKIQQQIDRMNDAKKQLEKAINEVKMHNSSISSASSRSDLFETDHNGNSNVPVLATMVNKNRSSHCDSLSDNRTSSSSVMNEKYEQEINELRLNLLYKTDEMEQYHLKMNKYRQYIHQMKDQHDKELNSLKNKFAKIIQELMDDKQHKYCINNHNQQQQHQIETNSKSSEKLIRKSNGHGTLDFDLI